MTVYNIQRFETQKFLFFSFFRLMLIEGLVRVFRPLRIDYSCMEESRCRREKGGDPVGEIHAGPPVAVTCSPLDYQLRQPFLPLLLFYNYCIAFFFRKSPNSSSSNQDRTGRWIPRVRVPRPLAASFFRSRGEKKGRASAPILICIFGFLLLLLLFQFLISARDIKDSNVVFC